MAVTFLLKRRLIANCSSVLCVSFFVRLTPKEVRLKKFEDLWSRPSKVILFFVVVVNWLMPSCVMQWAISRRSLDLALISSVDQGEIGLGPTSAKCILSAIKIFRFLSTFYV